jgi:hypothetical protein
MLKDVEFRPGEYGPEVLRILSLESGAATGPGGRAMPLVRSACMLPNAAQANLAIQGVDVSPSVKTGIYLYFSCWDEAHVLADTIHSPDGYFWHAIAHRQEPDPANSAYWFRQTGSHVIFRALAAEALAGGYPTGANWDPFAFIRFCQVAAEKTGSEDEQTAMEVQLVEWQLLFDHCARGPRH